MVNFLNFYIDDDDAFFQSELGWSVFGLLGRSWADTGLVCRPCVVGPGVGLLLLLTGRLWMWLSPTRRTRKKKGRRGLRPWPLRCLSQFLSERKDRLLRGRICCCICLRMSLRTFHRWGGLVFIVDDHDNFPNWIMKLNSMFPNRRMI